MEAQMQQVLEKLQQLEGESHRLRLEVQQANQATAQAAAVQQAAGRPEVDDIAQAIVQALREGRPAQRRGTIESA